MSAPGEVVQVGAVPCKRCFRVHDARKDPSRPKYWGTWADPDDGHAAYPMTARELVRWLLGDPTAALAAIRREDVAA